MMVFFFLLPVVSIQVLKSEQPIFMVPNVDIKIKSQQLNFFQEFCFLQEDLVRNQRYNAKISYLGSTGIRANFQWKHDELDLEKVLSSFQPMDTKRIGFSTNEKIVLVGFTRQYTQYCFYLAAYRNTIARDQEAQNEPFDYIIQLETVIFDDLPSYALIQYVGVIIVSLIGARILIGFIENPPKWTLYLFSDSYQKTD